MNARLRDAAFVAAALAGLYTLACLVGFAFLVLAFGAGLLRSVDILFYRGLILIALAFVATFGLLGLALGQRHWGGLRVRDAFAAATLSLSLNLSFLVVVPVTVDRSISIFMLSQMAARPDAIFTSQAMTALFTKVYVEDRHQIDRRLHEQWVSGNVEKAGDGYRISPHGSLVIATARIVARLFDSHAGILAPETASAPPQARR